MIGKVLDSLLKQVYYIAGVECGDLMGSMAELRDHAADLAPCALGVLAELMQDYGQPGPVRVAAAKGVVDYALKLADQVHEESLQRLDELLSEVRQQCQEEDQGS